MVSSPPQLPPIQELAPLEIIHEDDVSVVHHDFYKMRINAATHEESETTLESGAPLSEAEREFLRGAREYHAALRSGETTPKVQSTATSIDSQMAAVEPEPVGGKVAETSKSVTRKKSAQLESCERGAIDPSPGPEYVPAWYAKQFVAMKEKYQDDDTTRNVEVQHTPARAPIPTITEAEEEELRHGLVCVLREPDFAPKPITKGGAEGLHNREECAAGVAEKAGITAQVEHLATGEEHADTETA